MGKKRNLRKTYDSTIIFNSVQLWVCHCVIIAGMKCDSFTKRSVYLHLNLQRAVGCVGISNECQLISSCVKWFWPHMLTGSVADFLWAVWPYLIPLMVRFCFVYTNSTIHTVDNVRTWKKWDLPNKSHTFHATKRLGFGKPNSWYIFWQLNRSDSLLADFNLPVKLIDMILRWMKFAWVVLK